MTYSIAGRCARTGMFGVVVTTSSPAVGARCAFAKAGAGAVLTQHRTDPRLGPLGLELLSRGSSAPETINALVASTPHHGWRQLAVIDAKGGSAHFSGDKISSIHVGTQGRDCVAIGNIIRSTDIPPAMVKAFEAKPGDALSDRLLAALAAGRDAGGEFKEIMSAALLVVDKESFPYVDLRVDAHDDPIGELTRIWKLYAPQADDYVNRAIDPDRAEGFGELTPPA